MTSRAPTAAELAARRRATAASRARRPRAPRVEPPTGPAASYAASLAALLRPLDDALRDVLRSAGVDLAVTRRADAQGEPPVAPVPREVAAAARRAMARAGQQIVASAKLAEVIDRAARATDAHARAAWAKQAEAIGLEVAGDDLVLAARAKAFRAANVSHIKSLVAEHVARVHGILASAEGARVEVIQRAIQDATGASKSRAALIARDQVLSLNAQVTADRHKAAGIVEYTWSASRDQRVRSEHRELDGRRFRYDDPPIADKRSGRRGNPGTVWQCRCVAIPVLPD